MALYIKPEYFQTIHYYFFSLGIFSLTTSFLFTSYNAYTYIFMGFYIVNSAISWYLSWFMHARMKAVFIIKTGRYAASHVFLTVFAGGTAVAMYWFFELQFESIITAFLMVNFFVIFMGFMWYVLGVTRIASRFLEWQERGRLDLGRDMVMRFREKKGLKLVDDETMRSYRWGTDAKVDSLFMQVKLKSGKGEDFTELVRQLEMRISDLQVRELEQKIEKLGAGEPGKADKDMMDGYKSMVKSHEKSMLEYEKSLYRSKQKKS